MLLVAGMFRATHSFATLPCLLLTLGEGLFLLCAIRTSTTSAKALDTLDNPGEALLASVTPAIATPVPPLVGGEAVTETAKEDDSSVIVKTVRQEPTADNL